MKQQNKYEYLFDRLMMMCNFDLVKHNDGWGIEDRDACVGDSYKRFQNAAQIIDRLEIYIDDELIGSVREVLAHEFDIIVPQNLSRNGLLRAAKEKLIYDYGFTVDLLDMIVNHTDKINLENCKYKEEVKEMKKYTLKDWEEFCREALVMPPFEDDGDIQEWFDAHKIQIIANNCMMELEYDADAVNEIEFGLGEIYEAILGSGEATTGNTVGSQYRPAKMIDFIKVYIDRQLLTTQKKFRDIIDDVICHFDMARFEVARKYIKEHYQESCDEWECDFSRFDMVRELDFSDIEGMIEHALCSNYEVSYDPKADRSYIVDFSFRNSGEFVGFTWGNDVNDIDAVIHQYKSDIFGWIA